MKVISNYLCHLANCPSFPRILITFLKNFSDQGSLKLEGADSISYSSGKKKQIESNSSRMRAADLSIYLPYGHYFKLFFGTTFCKQRYLLIFDYRTQLWYSNPKRHLALRHYSVLAREAYSHGIYWFTDWLLCDASTKCGLYDYW